MPERELQNRIETDPEGQVIEAARDLVRARKRGIPLEAFLEILQNAVEHCAINEEFYCWSAEVDEIVAARLGQSEITDSRLMDWDANTYFEQGLTRIEGADRLYQFLHEGEH